MKVYVNGMTCNHCKMVVEESFSKIKGVKRVDVDLESGIANVEAEEYINESDFKNALEDTAYEVIKVE